MQVETYESTEIHEAPVEEREEFKRVAEKLGLIKQLAFVGEKTTCPFREMTTREQRVYGHLLTTHTKLEDYDADTIPLRALKAAELCRDNGWFPVFEVWHDTGVDDPLLVGKTSTNYNAKVFILARWGSVLESFEVLAQRALKRYTESKRVDLETQLASLEITAQKYMLGIGW